MKKYTTKYDKKYTKKVLINFNMSWTVNEKTKKKTILYVKTHILSSVIFFC